MRRKFLIRKIKSNFECQRCGLCCRAPGHVFMSGRDIERATGHLHISTEVFLKEYCETLSDNQRVLKKGREETCVFLTETGCKIHEAKPRQCADFPRVWREPDAFDYCEGIQKIKRDIQAEKTK